MIAVQAQRGPGLFEIIDNMNIIDSLLHPSFLSITMQLLWIYNHYGTNSETLPTCR